MRTPLGYQVGNPVPPGTFSIGAHTIHADVFLDGVLDDFGLETTTFYIDDASSATCTG